VLLILTCGILLTRADGKGPGRRTSELGFQLWLGAKPGHFGAGVDMGKVGIKPKMVSPQQPKPILPIDSRKTSPCIVITKSLRRQTWKGVEGTKSFALSEPMPLNPPLRSPEGRGRHPVTPNRMRDTRARSLRQPHILDSFVIVQGARHCKLCSPAEPLLPINPRLPLF
jgi:hypothetical protein